MGCGGSKDVAPSDAPADKASPAKKTGKKEVKNIEDEGITMPGKYERGTSFVVDMGVEDKVLAPKPKRLRELEKEGGNSPKITKADLEKKQAAAEERRLQALEEKTEFAHSDDAKRSEMESKSAQSKKSAKKTIDSKTKAAEQKRANELNEKKKKGQESSVKGKKARARRLDEALQAGSKIETGGEQDDDDDEDEDEANF
jgi:hypothetical protein